MSPIYIAGISMTVFGRHLERTLEDMAGEALQGALKDANCKISDIGTAYYAGISNGPLQGQFAIPGQVVMSKIGLEQIPMFNIDNGCAAGSSAVHLAINSLKAGNTDVAMALGCEKMNIADKHKALSMMEAGWDVSRADQNYETLMKMGEGVEIPPGSESEKKEFSKEIIRNARELVASADLDPEEPPASQGDHHADPARGRRSPRR